MTFNALGLKQWENIAAEFNICPSGVSLCDHGQTEQENNEMLDGHD